MTEDVKDQNEEAQEVEEESSEASDIQLDESPDTSEAEDTLEDDDAEETSEADDAKGTSEAEDDASEAVDAEDASSANGDTSEADEAEDAPDPIASPSEIETLDLARETEEKAKADSGEVAGVAAFFDHPAHLLYAAEQTRDAEYAKFDALSPFPIHGMDDALGAGRSWIPWVTFAAGSMGFMTAVGMEFGIMGYDWPMVFGGKPFISWPSFVPIMFELTVLMAGVTTAFVMLVAAGCFRKPFIIDPDITNDRFVLWISSDDERFSRNGVIEFMKGLNPSEIRTVRRDQ